MNTPSPREVLIVKLGAIGDLLMASPAIRAIKKHYAMSRVTLVVGKSCVSVVEGNTFIDALEIIDDHVIFHGGLFKKFACVLRLLWKLRKTTYDVIFVFHKDGRYNFLARCVRAHLRVGFKRDGRWQKLLHRAVEIEGIHHAIDHYLKVIDLAGVPHDGRSMDFFYPATVDQTVAAHPLVRILPLGKTVIGISPGGAKNVKESMLLRRWPPKHYRALIERLVDGGAQVILFGSKSDEPIINEMGLAGPATFNEGFETSSRIVNLVGKTTLAETAALMKRCSLVITHDSGPMHLASAVHVPVLALFGPTDPREKYPLGEHSNYLWKPHVVSCAPCYFEGKFPSCSHVTCMNSISVQEVLDAAARLVPLNFFHSKEVRMQQRSVG